MIPESVTSIGSWAFEDCSGLTEINYNAAAVADLTRYSDVFSNAGNDSEGITVTFGESVTSIPAYLFYIYSSSHAPNLVSVTIGSNVESIGDRAFFGCNSLTRVTIGEGVTSIGEGAFYGCRGLTEITIPDSVTSIGERAFQNRSSLTSITIPDSVTSIGERAFQNCSSLTSITIPEGVTSIGDGAFADCSGLAEITIPDSVTSIGSSAFEGCSSLASVTMGEGVTSIGSYAFYGCDNLTSVTFENTEGWWCSTDSTATSGTAIASSELADPSTAAAYLRSTYCDYSWHRS